MIPNYAAGLATAFQKRFLRPLAREKSPKVSVLEAESSRRRYGSTNFTAVELKEPNPAPPDNGAIEEKPRPHGHTTARHDKKFWPLL